MSCLGRVTNSGCKASVMIVVILMVGHASGILELKIVLNLGTMPACESV